MEKSVQRFPTTGTVKPTEHPLWPYFETWVRDRNRAGDGLADHPVWWGCFLAGADAAAATTAAADVIGRHLSRTVVPPPPPNPAPVTSRAAAEAVARLDEIGDRHADADLLKTACDGESPVAREAASKEICRRVSSPGGCCPKVSLLNGVLRRLNPDAPHAARRDALRRFLDKYAVDFQPWW